MTDPSLEAFALSTGLVALAEKGDKTQLLTLVLASRYRNPWALSSGILVATLLNHGLAGQLGQWLSLQFEPVLLRVVLGGFFLLMALWILVPDQLDEQIPQQPRLGVFGLTVVTFFMAEMGDKTQVATVGLAAADPHFAAVIFGTTSGMLIANLPLIVLGQRLADRIPFRATRIAAALLMATTGLMTLMSVEDPLSHGSVLLKTLGGALAMPVMAP